MAKSLDERLMNLPVVWDWYCFKGEDVFVGINYERSKKSNRPMMDIHYCATEALNGIVLKTVRFDRNKFKPSHLTFQASS
jgi:hypothetical protein